MFPQPIKENNMELTITQNGALYFVHHKVSKRRASPFSPLRTGSKQGLNIRGLPDSGKQGSGARR
jgi:hypothetical protein